MMNQKHVQKNVDPNNLLRVSVGVPAHNEEANLPVLLDSVLRQRTRSFILERIIVITDGCTDRTADLVKEYGKTNEKIELVNDGLQKGKSQRLNELYRMNESDVLITLDADTILMSDDMFEEILAPLKDPTVGVIAGNDQPLPGRTLIEKMLVARNAWWYEARKDCGRSTKLRKLT